MTSGHETPDGWQRDTSSRLTLALCIGAIMTGAILLVSCFNDKLGAPQGRPAGGRSEPVTAATVTSKAVPKEFKGLIGTVEARATVGVKAEVTGMLVAVHFQKGQNVKKGDLLFEIDPRSYQAALAQAEATLLRDKVQEANARKDAARQEDLLKKNIAAQVDYDKSITNADALAAAVHADEAAVQNARLELEHCSIRSPIDGKVGNLLVSEGNLVKANDVPLVNINQFSPIDVFFSILQSDLPVVRQYMSQGKLEVRALPPAEEAEAEVGELTFVDNSVDKSSGTVQLGATFENKQERLWPGQYVDVSMTLAVEKDALVVPAKAVQIGRDGKYVFIIKEDSTVEIRPVTVGENSGDDAVILKGLTRGERVVTDGQFRLTNGAKVEVKSEDGRGKSASGVKPEKEGSSGTAARKKAAP